MTVSVPGDLIRTYAGDGSTTAFSYPVRFDADDELVVILRDSDGNDTVKTLGTDFTVSGEGNDAGGTVTFTSAPASGVTVVIYRATEETQVVDLENASRNDAGAVELQLDRMVRMIQDHSAELGRSVKSRPGSSGPALPESQDGSPLVWDGSALANGPGPGNDNEYLGWHDGALANKTPVAVDESLPAVANTVPFRNAANTAYEAKPAGTTGLDVLAAGTVADARDAITVGTHVATRTALKALDTTKDTVAYLTEEGREGQFIWRAGDYSAEVAADTQEGIYIKADAIAATSGAWARVYDDTVYITWFGAHPDNADNTAVYNAAIALLPDGTSIRWPYIDGTWKGAFVPAVGRSFKLDLGGNTIAEVTDGSLFKMSGSASIVTTLTANTKYGDGTLTMADTSSLSAGDLIMLEDAMSRPSDGNKINQEILKIASVVDSTTVQIEDCVRSVQSQGTKNVYLITPVVGAEIKNGKAVIANPWDPLTPGSGFIATSPFRIDYSSGSSLENLETHNSYGEGVNMRYAYDFKMINCKVFDGHYRSTGAYGVSVYVGRKGYIDRPETRNTRNCTDLHASYDVTIYEPRGDDCYYGVSICHNVTGGKITVVRPKITRLVSGQNSHGVMQGRQGLAAQDLANYILHDVKIIGADIETLDDPTVTNQSMVDIATSYSNLLISDVTGRFAPTPSAPAGTASNIVHLGGQAFGMCVVENIRTQNTYDGTDFYGVGRVVDADTAATSTVWTVPGVLVVKDCYNGWGEAVFYARGLRNIITENLTHAQAMTTPRDVATAHGVPLTVNQSYGYVGRVS